MEAINNEKPLDEKLVGTDSSKKADKTPTPEVKVNVKRKPLSNRGIVIVK